METTATPRAAALDPIATLGSLYLKRLLRTQQGRAFMLSFMVQAEEADEQGVFDKLLDRVDDPELAKLVRIHRDDETRHAALLKGCLARNGAELVPIPAELDVVRCIDRHAGGFASAFVGGRTGVMEAYLLLQVIEERGVRQFPVIAEAMRPHDPESAATIDRITRDEVRHVRYAKAISRRYAPDASTLDATLERFRRAEARAFAEHSRALLAFAAERRLDGGSGTERLFWRAIVALGGFADHVAAAAASVVAIATGARLGSATAGS
jgi:rubrerythrin